MLHERRTNYSMIPIPLYRNLWLRSLATLVKKITVITFLVREEKGVTEDEMAGWHHWLSAHEFGWTPGAGDGQGGLACCSSWGREETDMTERLNWTEVPVWASQWWRICLPMKVQSLGQEGPLENQMATHSSILAWKMPWPEEPGGLQSMGPQSWTRMRDWAHSEAYHTAMFVLALSLWVNLCVHRLVCFEKVFLPVVKFSSV